MAADLAKIAKSNGIKYFMISFTDLFGGQRAKLVPAAAIADMQKDGAGFAGFATWLDMTPAHPDLFAMPDPDAVIQLPWKKEVAWVAADGVMDGAVVQQAPRTVLKNVVAAAAAKGLRMKSGVEAEFFLITKDGQAISDEYDNATKPCYDQQALMRRYDVIAEICDNMLSLGWAPYQNDHEDANGQFEMNWGFDDALVTADRHSFFKFMVRSIAEKHGLRATFMPKPFARLTGSGCHVHLSIWDKAGKKNTFADDKNELGLSAQGYHFLGGIMAHATGMAAITNPDGEQLQAHQRAAHGLRRHVVAELDHLDRQQPHPHGARAGAGPLRASPARRRGEPLSAAGRDPRRRHRRHRHQGRSGKTLRHRHVCRGAQGEGRAKTAAQSFGCAPRFREGQGFERRARRGIFSLLSETQEPGVEFLRPAFHRVGAREHAGYLRRAAASRTMDKMRLLVFQHIDCEHPGVLRKFLAEDGVEWDAVELDAGEANSAA